MSPYFIGFDGATNALVATVADLNTSSAFSAEDVLAGGTIHTYRPTHSAELVPLLNRLCDEYLSSTTGLNAALTHKPSFIACGLGPGSFTGLRIAVTTAKTLAQGLEVPVFVFSSLHFFHWCLTDSMGQSLATPDGVVMLDAKKKRAYIGHGSPENGSFHELDQSPAQFLEEAGRPLTILTNNPEAIGAYIDGRRPGETKATKSGAQSKAQELWHQSRILDFDAKEQGALVVGGQRLAAFVRSQFAQMDAQKQSDFLQYNSAELLRIKPNYMRMPEVRYPEPKQ